VLARRETLHLIRCEKARTDRSGLPFSVIRIKADFRTPAGQRQFVRLIRFCRDSLRLTDQLGCLEDGRLGLILPLTDSEGATTVANKLHQSFGRSIQTRVYTYPVLSWIENLGDERGEHSDDDSDETVDPVDHLLVRRMPVWKRALDVVGSGLGLMLLSPVLLLLTLLIKTTSPGPVLYKQRRTGLGGKPFTIYKFRSMVVDADAQKQFLFGLNEQDGPAFKIKDDPRITRIGKVMRKTSLDELPQLWNVFRGDMTLVGPRPLPCSETAACAPWHLERLAVKPGLTCTWQVKGRSKVSFDEWMRMDLHYVRSITPWHDIRLLTQTVYTLLFARNGV
jgi:lipopolysaccharide/colanic/teichoic acid biosynthesis glycosyltransferase